MRKRFLAALILTLAVALGPLGGVDAAAGAGGEKRAQMLVTPAWVAEQMEKGKVVLLHVGEKAGYDAEHIPGAQYITFEDVAMRNSEGTPLELRPLAELEDLAQRLGISENTAVVIYMGKDWITPGARVYFTLDYLGLGAQTAVLDGGLPAWKAEGRAVTAEVPTVARGNYKARPRSEIVVTADWVQKNIGNAAVTLVDARTLDFYTGASDARGAYPRPGHIPGAVNVPYRDLWQEGGKLKEAAALEEIFRAAGVKPGARVVTYCHIGQQASLAYFVAKSLGYDAAMYDGSFTEWTAKNLPVEKSAAAAPAAAPPK